MLLEDADDEARVLRSASCKRLLLLEDFLDQYRTTLLLMSIVRFLLASCKQDEVLW